jgi:hypothetical protein
MTRHLYAVGIAIAVVALPTDLAPARAQQANCLHGADETPDQAARRKLALTTVRRINTHQIFLFAKTKTYHPLTAFADVPVQPPPGFSLQMTLEGTRYAVSVKDTLDPCAFAYFSDQEQIIYTAQPIQ